MTSPLKIKILRMNYCRAILLLNLKHLLCVRVKIYTFNHSQHCYRQNLSIMDYLSIIQSKREKSQLTEAGGGNSGFAGSLGILLNFNAFVLIQQ